MPLIPEFQIGLWNGWWFSTIFLTINYLLVYIMPKENRKEMMEQVRQSKGKDKLLNYISFIPYLGIMLYAILIPLKLGTSWFYIGAVIFVSGMIALIVATAQLFFREPGRLMTRGFYQTSRNPQYVMYNITWIGIGVATMSLVILMLVLLSIIVQHFIMLCEVRIRLENYDVNYCEYMKRTPRYFLFL